jgi:beta-phosphoglucomutase family hydrolase
VLGLPEQITACLFDLDGVLTPTADVHARAWKQVFDQYLRQHDQPPFDLHDDYDEYVDGKPREDGITDFLKARGITPSPEDIAQISDTKNDLVLEIIREQGVSPYPGSVRYLSAARDAGLRRAVVSSSHNTEEVLQGAGIDEYLEERVDGNTKDALKLNGKPAPDTFLEGAKRLRVPPDQAAVFEDSLAGVQAGKAGSFGFVVGVNRANQRQALLDHGADVVVDDLAELLQ